MGLSLRGQTSGAIDINAPNVAGNNTITLPGSNGAANQFYKNSGTAGTLTHSSMIEDSSGQIGIGTVSPRDPVHIYHPTNNVNLLIESGDANSYLAFKDNATTSDAAVYLGAEGNNLKFITSAEERLRITSAGLVGIGTDNPTSTLSLGGNMDFKQSSNLTTTAGYLNIAPTSTLILDSSTGHIQFRIATSERMRLDSSGRMLVGALTAPTDTGNGAHYSKLISFGNTVSSTGDGRLALCRGTTASSLSSGNGIGEIHFADSAGGGFAMISAFADATPGAGDYPGRLVFSTTADGASSPTERMRIRSDGYINAGGYIGSGYHRFNGINALAGTTICVVSGYQISGGTGQDTAVFYSVSDSAQANSAVTALKVFRQASTQRSINAAGSVNASGNDYAEYMVKSGNFTIDKGALCGIDSEGKLTNIFNNAISFVVKSTNPSYVGGDTWHLDVGEKPGGYNDSRTEEEIATALVVYEEALETARQLVDRIAFSGQVPINVIGATPGQYIVPVTTIDGGITGEAKNEADLTLVEYMKAVGKVIAIEDDGRARIIVKIS